MGSTTVVGIPYIIGKAVTHFNRTHEGSSKIPRKLILLSEHGADGEDGLQGQVRGGGGQVLLGHERSRATDECLGYNYRCYDGW